MERPRVPLEQLRVVSPCHEDWGKMSGDDRHKRGNLRALYAMMWAYPGKKLLFMGGEFAQQREWNHDSQLDWGLLEDPAHFGMFALIRDLNHLYRARPALHQRDDRDPGGARGLHQGAAVEGVDVEGGRTRTAVDLRPGSGQSLLDGDHRRQHAVVAGRRTRGACRFQESPVEGLSHGRRR